MWSHKMYILEVPLDNLMLRETKASLRKSWRVKELNKRLCDKGNDINGFGITGFGENRREENGIFIIWYILPEQRLFLKIVASNQTTASLHYVLVLVIPVTFFFKVLICVQVRSGHLNSEASVSLKNAQHHLVGPAETEASSYKELRWIQWLCLMETRMESGKPVPMDQVLLKDSKWPVYPCEE